MKLRSTLTAALLGLAATSLAHGPATAQDEPDTEEMVNAINGLYGSHKGYRAVHAKGFCGAGSLKATPEAAADGHMMPPLPAGAA